MRAAPGRRGKWLLTAGIVMLGCWATYSCDSHVQLHVSEVQWDQLVVMSAVPAKKTVNETGAAVFEPVCRAGQSNPDGVIINVLFQGTSKKGEEEERDFSIKPFDRIDKRVVKPELVTPSIFKLALTCMEEYPDTTDTGCSGEKGGADGLDIGAVDFYSYGRGDAVRGRVALAVLVDMSGSMSGLVNAFPPYNEDTKSRAVANFPAGFDFSPNATDPAHLRLNAVVELIKSLNPDDDLIVFTYNENKIDVVCDLTSEADPTYDVKKQNCFDTQRSFVLGPDPDGVGGPLLTVEAEAVQGRSPLWYALKDAYEFMNVSEVANSADFKHILVINDGPDTCSPSAAELNVCAKPCTQYYTEFSEIQSMINAQDMADRIPVHFVQLAAKGYKERDGRQLEVACLTGGHHVFVNTAEIGKGNLKDYLSSILLHIRYTFRGYWRFSMLTSWLGQNTKPNRGHVYTLAGEGKVLPDNGSILVKAESPFRFADESASGQSTSGDARVSVRKPCIPGDDDGICTPPADSIPQRACGTMTYWCDKESLTCKSAEVWSPDGEQGGCGTAEVFIRIFQSTNDREPKIVQIKDVPTVCCSGACRPPRPPMPPSTVKPTVFYYDKDGEWYLDNPEDPNSAWVVDANFRPDPEDASVTITGVMAELKYADTAALAFPDDWNCPADKSVNCFPAPSDGSEEQD